MEVNEKILKSMNYVKESSYRTDTNFNGVILESLYDKELLSLDYSNLKCDRTNVSDEDF